MVIPFSLHKYLKNFDDKIVPLKHIYIGMMMTASSDGQNHFPIRCPISY